MSYVILRSNGKLFRVLREPFESQQQSMDRAWYIVKRMEEDEKRNYQQVYVDSLVWIYQKYLGVSYGA